MNLEKALSILGLSRTYTEEDLKRTYRKLIAKYHPDLYESKSENEKKFAEEKTKDINTAKELLEKRLKDKTSTNFRSTTRSNYKTSSNAANQRYQTYTYMSELRKRKMELRKEIVDILDEINNIADNNDELLKHIKNQLQTSLGLFKNIIDIVNSVSELSDMQSKIYTKIINILNNYAKDYCKKHNITVDINTLENKSLKKLQEQLEELRKKKEEETRNIKILEDVSLNFDISKFKLALMCQYTPDFCPNEYKEIKRRVTTFEYNSVVDKALALGYDGYIQDITSANTIYTPDFCDGKKGF